MGFKKLTDHLISMSLAAGLAACAGSQPVPDAQANKAEEKPAAVAEAPKPAPAPDANVAQGQAELEKAMEALRNVSVFFEFDSSTLTSEAKDKLSAVGTVLAKYAELKVRIEGNCDERGSEQYNLALGQRRADAAKRYLASMGAQPEPPGRPEGHPRLLPVLVEVTTSFQRSAGGPGARENHSAWFLARS